MKFILSVSEDFHWLKSLIQSPSKVAQKKLYILKKYLKVKIYKFNKKVVNIKYEKNQLMGEHGFQN